MRSMAKRRVGGATRASAQKGFLSPMPCAQWRMASLVATSIYGSGRGTVLPIRERGASGASGVMVGNRATGMWQLWSGLGRGSRHDVASLMRHHRLARTFTKTNAFVLVALAATAWRGPSRRKGTRRTDRVTRRKSMGRHDRGVGRRGLGPLRAALRTPRKAPI